MSLELTPRVSLFGGAAAVWTPSTVGVSAFDPMMFGFWPFTATLGMLTRW